MNIQRILKAAPLVLTALLLTACATEPSHARPESSRTGASSLTDAPVGTTDRNQAAHVDNSSINTEFA